MASSLLAQPKITRSQNGSPKSNVKNYIKKYAQEAIHQMIEFRIPASVTLAQAIFESGSGTSELALNSNNHFGIKCQNVWLGDTIIRTDDQPNECFRKYYYVEDSYRDHSLFLITRKRYAFLFEFEITDYKSWCYALKKTSYATYPQYAEELIRIIEENQLYDLDRVLPLKPIIAKRENKNLLNATLKPSKYNPRFFELKDYTKDGLIFIDEKEVLVQSIDMILQGSDTEAMAGNP